MNRKTTLSRRDLLKQGTSGLAALAVGPTLLAISQPLSARTLADVGPLQAPDANGIRLPAGFSSRIVAAAGQRVRRSFWNRTRYIWHSYPDGGATFPTDDGGWIYVSNSETISLLGGGAAAIRFNADGSVNDAYRILGGTNLNCAGGPTPWQTWLSCEEADFGRVYECDPFGHRPAQLRRGLGYFKHEAAAIDPVNLDEGILQVAAVDAQGYVTWLDLPNPTPNLLETPTREQLPHSAAFRGGEGCWYSHGHVYFTTKGDNRVWQLDTNLNRLSVIYDAATADNPILTGVDNLTVSGGGDVLVAEDGGDMQIVVIDKQGDVAPLIQVIGQDDSEITGPAFSPDGQRLYFSSQRGSNLFGGGNGFGITYEIRGPFEKYVTL